jgi:hypothetical protein
LADCFKDTELLDEISQKVGLDELAERAGSQEMG